MTNTDVFSATDALDHATTFGYDEIGRRVVTDPNGDSTTFAFDTAGNMASLTDPLDNTTAWTYDHAGRVVTETNELDDARTFEYDVAGRLTKKTDRLGRVTEYVYDDLGRHVEERWKDGQSTVRQIAFSHNRLDERLTAADPAAEYTYEYDGFGRTASVGQQIGLTFGVQIN